MHQVMDAIVRHLYTIPGVSVELKLDIDAEGAEGIDKVKSRVLLESANTLGFLEENLD